MSSPLHEYPRGPRISLREFRPDDLLAWQRIAGDPRVAAHTPWPALPTPDTAGAWLAETARMAQSSPRRSFYLGVEQYGDLIGTATLDILSFPHRQGEIGVYLRPDRWAEGLGTETARLLLELAFARLELHRVQSTPDPRNTPGLRVAEHVKMRPEGILLDRYLVAGHWQDRAMYAITLPEWRGVGRVTTTPTAAGMSFGGGPEEPALRTPLPPQPEAPDVSEPLVGEPLVGEPLVGEPLVGEPLADETVIDETMFTDPTDDQGAEPNEPQVLTAQIVMEQIEVVEILPREP